MGNDSSKIYYEGSISCWNIYSKREEKDKGPDIRFEVTSPQIGDVTINKIEFKKDAWWSDYSLDPTPKDKVKGNLITSKHSPYRGSLNFDLANEARLILPQDIKPDKLKKADVRPSTPDLIENGVLMLAPTSEGNKAAGKLYVRMKCSESRKE